MLLDYQQYLFCGCDRFHRLDHWEYLLSSCYGCCNLAATRDLQFILAKGTSLGVPLALFTMNHHVANFVLIMMEHL